MSRVITSVRAFAIFLCLAMVLPLALSFQAVAAQQAELDEFNERYGPEQAIMEELSKRPGGFAWDYLQNDTYPNLLVEVDWYNTMYYSVRGDFFEVFLDLVDEYCEKDEVNFIYENAVNTGEFGSPAISQGSYDMDDLRRLADQSSDFSKSGDTCVMHILVLNGYYEPNSRIVGLALDATSFVVFSRYMEPWEAAIIVGHELGHLLGLVGALGLEDQYTPPGAGSHYDVEEPKHCTDPRCMMSYTVDTVNTYCDKCEADLAYVRESQCPYTIEEAAPEVDWTALGVSLTLTVNVLVIGYAAMVAQDQSLSSQMARRGTEVKTSSKSLARWSKVLLLSAREVSNESMYYVLEPANVTEGRTSRLTLILSVITIIVILVLAYYL
jgi:hypothetical protein